MRIMQGRFAALAAGAIAAVALLTAASVEAQLAGHWQFDNSANVGQANFSSDLLAVGNAAYTAAGKLGGALSLDGAGDYLRVDGSDSLAAGMPTGDSSYTMSAFIQTTNSARNGIIGWGGYGSTGQVNAFRTGDGAALTNYGWGGANDYANVAAPTIYDGAWHHVLATYDAAASTKRIYFDGAEIGAGFVLAGNLNVAAANFRIGSTNFGEFLNGQIDDVAVWSEALTGDEVVSLFNVGDNSDLMYDAGTFDLLKQVHDAGSGSLVIGDLYWTYADNLAGSAGLSGSGTNFTLVVNAASGTGLTSHTVPEPASIALWSMLAVSVAVCCWRRRKWAKLA